MAKKQKRVLLALGWYDYRLHQGIEKYAQEHGWHLYADYTREKVIPWGWEGDGILAWLGAGDDLAEFVKSAKHAHGGFQPPAAAVEISPRAGGSRPRRPAGGGSFSDPRLHQFLFLQRRGQLVLRGARPGVSQGARRGRPQLLPGCAGWNRRPTPPADRNGSASANGSPPR